MHVAVATGMRQGEILGLKFSDIEGSFLNITRQVARNREKGLQLAPPKTEAGIRRIMIGEETKEILLAQRHHCALDTAAAGEKWQETDLIFPGPKGHPWGQRSLLRPFYQVLEDAELPRIRFHDLRNTAASLMLSKNAPLITVSWMLGHAKPSITLDYYGHLVPGAQEIAVDAMRDVVTLTEWQSAAETIAPELRQEGL